MATLDVVVGGFGGESIALGFLDSRNGSLKLSSYSTAAGPHPDFVAWLRKGDVLFGLVANEAGSDAAITAVQMQRQPGGSLKAVRTASLRVDDPCHVAVHPSGRWAFSASYPAGTVTVIEVIHITSFQEGAGPAPTAAAPTAQAAVRPAAPGSPWLLLRKASVLPTSIVGEAAHQVTLAGPGGRFVYVPCLKSDWVGMYVFQAATGSLAPLPPPPSSSSSSSSSVKAGSSAKPPASRGQAAAGDNRVHLPPGSGPRHILFHPTLPVAYVLCELSSTIAVFDWDPATGQLQADFGSQPGRIVSLLPPNSTCSSSKAGACSGKACLQAGAELVISADGRWLYASNRGTCGGLNNIAMFAVDVRDGSLKSVGWEDGGGDINFPRHISLTPDNAFLLVANQHGGSVTVFSRDAASGRLSRVSTVPAAAADGSAAAVVEPAFVAVVPM